MLFLHEFHVPYIPYTPFISTAADRELQYSLVPLVPTEEMTLIFVKTHFHTPPSRTKSLELFSFEIYGVNYFYFLIKVGH